MSKINTFELDTSSGKMVFTVGKVAQKANGSVILQCQGTTVLATVVMSDYEEKGMDYFPLMIDYEENYYAAGKIKGSRFVKRKGRPGDAAILNGRLIDRALRPLFDQRIRRSIQVIINVLSYDRKCDPGALSLVAASAAIQISDIPMLRTVAASRIGKDQDGKLLVKASNEEDEESTNPLFDLTVATNESEIVMLESCTEETTEEDMYNAIKLAFDENKPIIEMIDKMKSEIGKDKIAIEDIVDPKEAYHRLEEKIRPDYEPKIEEILRSDSDHKEKYEKLEDLKHEASNLDLLEDFEGVQPEDAKEIVDELAADMIRNDILDKGVRFDGRKLDQVRPLEIEVGVLPRVHGSALFSRGETQVLSVATLGAPGDVQLIDEMEVEDKKRYIHHYNFPPFAPGEARPLRGPSRRDIGHGALAESAVMPMIPSQEAFPYTILVHSEVMSSNCSTSMASVCGSSLALMDAGVPLPKQVAGAGIGLFVDPKDPSKYKIVTDIAGKEDHRGNMDFKIAGTKDGITAIQMDIKLEGITFDILKEALARANTARAHILEEMNQVLEKPRTEMSEFAPRIHKLKIEPDQIREVIGPGGKIINGIIDETGVSIDIEDDGTVLITGEDQKNSMIAIKRVKAIVKKVAVGDVMEGKVTKMMNFGAFVEVSPSQEGLVHVSKMSRGFVKDPGELVKVGQMLEVKVDEIDSQGRINLSLVHPFKGQERGNDRPPRKR